MVREFFVHPKTGRIDPWLIALLFTSLLGFAGATMLWLHSALTT